MSSYESLDDLNINTVIDENEYIDFKLYSIKDRLTPLRKAMDSTTRLPQF